jgi:hypothetical protein
VGGGGEEACGILGFLAGVRRTKIEAGRYKTGWMRGSARAGGRGGRQRWWPGPAGSPRGGGRAQAWLAMATAGDRRTARQIPPVAIRRGGYLLPPPVDRRRPVDGDGSNGGDKKYYRRVIEVIRR